MLPSRLLLDGSPFTKTDDVPLRLSVDCSRVALLAVDTDFQPVGYPSAQFSKPPLVNNSVPSPGPGTSPPPSPYKISSIP